jgi:hypothetical protein
VTSRLAPQLLFRMAGKRHRVVELLAYITCSARGIRKPAAVTRWRASDAHSPFMSKPSELADGNGLTLAEEQPSWKNPQIAGIRRSNFNRH